MSKQNERYPLSLTWPFGDPVLNARVDAFTSLYPEIHVRDGLSQTKDAPWYVSEMIFPDKQSRKEAITRAWEIEGVAVYTSISPAPRDKFFPVTPEMVKDWLKFPPTAPVSLPSLDTDMYSFRHSIIAAPHSREGVPKASYFFTMKVEVISDDAFCEVARLHPAQLRVDLTDAAGIRLAAESFSSSFALLRTEIMEFKCAVKYGRRGRYFN